jgi:hypothetical protein
MNETSIAAVAIAILAFAPGDDSPGTAYYVDAVKGDDSNPGTSPERAWKTIKKANETSFAAGDRLLLAGGQTFAAPLRLLKDDRGTKEQPVLVTSFGNGRATLDAGAGTAIELADCEHVTVKNLALVGCGRDKGSDGIGLSIRRTRGVEVDEVEASGFRVTGVSAGGDEALRLTRVHAHDNGFAGISVHGGHDLPFSRELYIGHCIANDNPGDPKNKTNHSGNGIVVGGLKGGLIEYCEAFNNGWDMPRRGNGPVGIWGWFCDRLVIQHCVSHDNKTSKGGYDGGGFDLDGGATNSVLQYNLSFNNHGTGYLLCQYEDAEPWKDNICRYNVSVNDGLTNHFDGIHFWAGGKGMSGAQVYNNVVVNAKNAVNSTHDIPGLVFRNNVFISDSDAITGPLGQAVFEHNLYWSRKGGAVFRNGNTAYATLADWSKAAGKETVQGRVAGLASDPRIGLPDGPERLPRDPKTLANMPFFRLMPGSSCAGAGTAVPDNGGRDFFGGRLAPGRKPSIGVHEPSGR